MRRLAWPLLLTLTACGRSCDDHPYVPYAIGDEARDDAAAGDAGSTAAPPSAADGGAAMLRAPDGAATWDVFGTTLTATEGHVLAFAALLGADGSNAGDVLAIEKPADAPGPLTVFDVRLDGKRAEAPRELFSTKDAVLDASCSSTAVLEQGTTASPSLSLSYTCAGHGDPPSRFVALFGKTATGLRTRLAVRVRDRASDPPLALHIDGSDVDHDAVGDVTLTADVEGAAAKIVLLDRSAGLSRDKAEPAASFATLASGAAARLEKKDVKGALAATQRIRALHRALCDPSPRVSPIAGMGALPCDVAGPLRKAEIVNARALALDGARLRALFELDVAQRLGEKVDVKMLAPNVEVVKAKDARTIDQAVSRPARGAPSFSPLAFEADGSFVMRTSDTDALRVVPGAAASGDDAGSPTAWPLPMMSPDHAQRIVEIYDPCDEAAVRVTLAGATSTEDVSLPVETLIGKKCEGARGGPVGFAPLGWSAAGVSLLVLGEYVQIAPTFEATRAPLPQSFDAQHGGAANGAFVVARTPFGVAVDDGKHARLVRNPDGAAFDGSYCVVARDGSKVACLVGDKAVLLTL
jgi:hypothetical protein